MKVIIPVAGVGSKLRPHTNTQPKALIPLGGKTILGTIIQQFRDKGLKEFVFIVGHLGDKIEEYVKTKHPDIKSVFVYQNERKGIAHAVWLTRSFVLNEEIIIVLGDTICDLDVKKFLKSKESSLVIKKVEDPRQFGVAVIDEKNYISKVFEKPQIPISNMALVGVYKIKETSLFFDAIEKTLAQEHSETKCPTLTESIEILLKNGIPISSFKVENWFDCGKVENILNTNAILLKKNGGKNPLKSSTIINSVIMSPVSIPKSCIIEHSIIGPNVSLGEFVKISNAIINNSIIGSYSKIDNIILNNSLIGSDTEVCGNTKSLNIGDDTKINF